MSKTNFDKKLKDLTVRINYLIANPVSSGHIKVKVSLSSAQILALHTTPIEAVAAPGAGKAIVVTSASVRLNYGTATYTGQYLYLKTATAGSHQKRVYSINGSSSNISLFNSEDSSNQVVENQALNVDIAAQTTTGDGTIDVYITYEVITL